MKKILFSLSLLITVFAYGQVTIFEDDFESYTDFIIDGIGDWTVMDFDGLNTYTGGSADPNWDNAGAPMAFQIFNPSAAGVTNESDPGADENRNFDPHSGAKYLASWASVPQAGLGNDDWAVSPAITLGASGNMLEFYVKALSSTYGDEPYEVGIYVGDGNPQPAEFTIVHSGEATYPDWELISIDLANYPNETIKIGFHYTGTDVYMLMIDSVLVTASTMSVSDVDNSRTGATVYPNPAIDFVSINLAEGFNAETTTVSFTNLSGKRVSSVKYADQINVSNLAKGMYIIEIRDGKKVETKKLIIQ